MTCSGCSTTIVKTLQCIEGVKRAVVNPATEHAHIWYDPRNVSVVDLYQAIKDAGYRTGTSTLRLRIEGIYCSGRITQLEEALKSVPGVALDHRGALPEALPISRDGRCLLRRS
jgi:Cu+-exporting ATPase